MGSYSSSLEQQEPCERSSFRTRKRDVNSTKSSKKRGRTWDEERERSEEALCGGAGETPHAQGQHHQHPQQAHHGSSAQGQGWRTVPTTSSPAGPEAGGPHSMMSGAHATRHTQQPPPAQVNAPQQQQLDASSLITSAPRLRQPAGNVLTRMAALHSQQQQQQQHQQQQQQATHAPQHTAPPTGPHQPRPGSECDGDLDNIPRRPASTTANDSRAANASSRNSSRARAASGVSGSSESEEDLDDVPRRPRNSANAQQQQQQQQQRTHAVAPPQIVRKRGSSPRRAASPPLLMPSPTVLLTPACATHTTAAPTTTTAAPLLISSPLPLSSPSATTLLPSTQICVLPTDTTHTATHTANASPPHRHQQERARAPGGTGCAPLGHSPNLAQPGPASHPLSTHTTTSNDSAAANSSSTSAGSASSGGAPHACWYGSSISCQRAVMEGMEGAEMEGMERATHSGAAPQAACWHDRSPAGEEAQEGATHNPPHSYHAHPPHTHAHAPTHMLLLHAPHARTHTPAFAMHSVPCPTTPPTHTANRISDAYTHGSALYARTQHAPHAHALPPHAPKPTLAHAPHAHAPHAHTHPPHAPAHTPAHAPSATAHAPPSPHAPTVRAATYASLSAVASPFGSPQLQQVGAASDSSVCSDGSARAMAGGGGGGGVGVCGGAQQQQQQQQEGPHGQGIASQGQQGSLQLGRRTTAPEAVEHDIAPEASAESSDVDEDEYMDFDPIQFIKSLPPLSQVVPSMRSFLLPTKTHPSHQKTIVLDLDETLVHSSLETPAEACDFSFPVFFSNQEHMINVRCRPHLREFMERVAQLFEVVVFTASQKIYAERLLDILDPTHKLIKHRIYRDACVVVEGNYLKDLTVLGRDLRDTFIIDNSPQAFGFQVDNGIPIESWYSDDADTELLQLLPFLEHLATAEDVRPAIAARFRLRQLINAAPVLE